MKIQECIIIDYSEIPKDELYEFVYEEDIRNDNYCRVKDNDTVRKYLAKNGIDQNYYSTIIKDYLVLMRFNC